MNKMKSALSASRYDSVPPKINFRNEEGAIDLSSIMVGIIVIGLIGGVIAATIFAVIPWTQDNAAKQQLDSVSSAESAYMGLSSAVPMALPPGSNANTFGSSVQLQAANLLTPGASYCVSSSADGKSYVAYSQSASGQVFTATDKNSKPVAFNGALPSECNFIMASITGTSSATQAPYVDPTPTKTTLTYRCDSSITGTIPLKTNLIGTETWNDGVTNTYNGAAAPLSRTLTAGVTYTMTFDGTYSNFNGATSGSTLDLTGCLRSVDHWGLNTGVTDASDAFYGASNLTNVPDHIPTTITTMYRMLDSATIFNDPNVSKWDVSNVTDMSLMFSGDSVFNQSLNNWNVSKVVYMPGMFQGDSVFNQPLNNWNTASASDMSSMFSSTKNFNQSLNNWNVSTVRNMGNMFNNAAVFNQPLDKWNVSNVTNMNQMFYNSPNFSSNLSGWKTTSLQSGIYFAPASFPDAYLPPNTSK